MQDQIVLLKGQSCGIPGGAGAAADVQFDMFGLGMCGSRPQFRRESQQEITGNAGGE